MPRDRGRRTPTRTTPTLSQLKATYAAKRTTTTTTTAPRRVSPRETARPAYSPTISPARPTGSIKPFTTGAVLVAPRATTPAVPTPARLPTGYDPATGGIYTGGLPQGQSQYRLPARQTAPWMQTGYDPGIGGISGPLQQQFMPQYWAATEQKRAAARYAQGPGAPWTAGGGAVAAPSLPTLPPWQGDGGVGGTGGYGGGGGGGGYYRAPSVSSGARASSVGRAVSRGLVNWRIGI